MTTRCMLTAVRSAHQTRAVPAKPSRPVVVGAGASAISGSFCVVEESQVACIPSLQACEGQNVWRDIAPTKCRDMCDSFRTER
jgi:hypothetical protein